MPTQAEIDAEYENAELRRRVEQLETTVNALKEAGLDRLIESGLLQFDGIPIRWDSQGMQVESASEVAAVHFVGKLVSNPGGQATRSVLAGEIDTANTTASVYLRAYGDTNKSSALSVSADAQSDVYSTKITDGWFGIATAVSPSTITANQDNYNPTNLQYAGVLRLASDASRDITGIARGSDGRILIAFNVGSFPIVFKDESASSTAANRLALGGSDLTLNSGESTPLWYDSTSSRWRPF